MPQEQLIEQEEDQGLVVIENKSVIKAFSEKGGLDSIIEEARQVVDGFEHDLSTVAGRAKTASVAYKVSKFKSRLDGMGKDLVSDWKKKAKAVDDNRKGMREALDAIRDEARKPLTEWEAKEERRGQKHRDAIAAIRFLALVVHVESGEKLTLPELEENLAELNAIKITESWEEFELEADKARDESANALSIFIGETRAQIAKDAELERLKKEEIERKKKEYEDNLKKEAAEKARILAEEKAENERIEAERVATEKAEKIEADKKAALRREKEQKERAERAEQEKEAAEKLIKLNAERAENDRIAAEKQSKIDAEKAEADRIAAEKKAKQDTIDAAEKAKQDQIDLQNAINSAEKAKQEKREANTKHIGKIRKAAKESLIVYLGIDEDLAKRIVMAVHNAEIKNISIKY